MGLKPKYKSLIYISRPTKEKTRDRVRPTSIPEEASRRFFEQGSGERPDLITIVRPTDPITLPLAYHLISLLKQKVFRDQISESDMKWEIGFLAYEYLNTIIHILGLGSIALAHYPVNNLSVERGKVRISKDLAVDVVRLRASGFYLWPFRETTERIRFEADLYDLEDIRDYNAFSNASFIVDIYGLMKDLKLRWDIDWRY